MKKIGFIGGMSWESSLVYYKLANEIIKSRLGGLNSCNCVLDSVNFSEIEKLQHRNDWKALNNIMATSAKNLENAGADLIVLCTNTMHLCNNAITDAVSIPFLHIADATGEAIKAKNVNKVLLLGTKFTMEKDFYTKRLKEKYGINVIIPNKDDREQVHKIIYTELVLGNINLKSKAIYKRIIEKHIAEDNIEGVILGCTEIPLLIKDDDTSVFVFDTTSIHVTKAIDIALV